jgi:hypothetical protein
MPVTEAGIRSVVSDDRSTSDIPQLSENPKICGINDVEVVGQPLKPKVIGAGMDGTKCLKAESSSEREVGDGAGMVGYDDEAHSRG